MFVDIAKIKIKAGNGGNGAVSFHREKYVANGGPMEGTVEKVEILYLRLTVIFLHSPTLDIKENM